MSTWLFYCLFQFYWWLVLWSNQSITQAANSTGTDTPPCHQRCRLLNWVMVTRWTVPQLFRPEDAASMFSKEKNYIWIHATTEQLCTLLQIILKDFCPREDDSVSCTASSLHDRALSVDCMVKCVHREWFLELFVSPRSDFHDTIISVFNAVLPEGPKVTGI